MKKHLKYLWYVLRHKWFVMLAGRRVGVGWWTLLIHDLSKFAPAEWGPYVEYFYGTKQSTEFFELQAKYGVAELAPWGECVKDRFTEAWLHHQHKNPHHWQYWIMREESGNTFCVPMPRRYALEMVADWMGAGRAINGRWEVREWYAKNQALIQIHPSTRTLVEQLVNA